MDRFVASTSDFLWPSDRPSQLCDSFFFLVIFFLVVLFLVVLFLVFLCLVFLCLVDVLFLALLVCRRQLLSGLRLCRQTFRRHFARNDEAAVVICCSRFNWLRILFILGALSLFLQRGDRLFTFALLGSDDAGDDGGADQSEIALSSVRSSMLGRNSQDAGGNQQPCKPRNAAACCRVVGRVHLQICFFVRRRLLATYECESEARKRSSSVKADIDGKFAVERFEDRLAVFFSNRIFLGAYFKLFVVCRYSRRQIYSFFWACKLKEISNIQTRHQPQFQNKAPFSRRNASPAAPQPPTVIATSALN